MPLVDYLPTDSDLPDQFEPDDADRSGWEFQFPCCVCKFRDRTPGECSGCVHYCN